MPELPDNVTLKAYTLNFFLVLNTVSVKHLNEQLSSMGYKLIISNIHLRKVPERKDLIQL